MVWNWPPPQILMKYSELTNFLLTHRILRTADLDRKHCPLLCVWGITGAEVESAQLWKQQPGVESKRIWHEETPLSRTSSVYPSHYPHRPLHCLTPRPIPSCDVQHSHPRNQDIQAAPSVETYISKQRHTTLLLHAVHHLWQITHVPPRCPLGFYVTVACTDKNLAGYNILFVNFPK